MKLVIIFFTCQVLSAQSSSDSSSSYLVDGNQAGNKLRLLEARIHGGGHLYSGKTLENELEFGYGSFQIRYGWQSTDEASWSAKYNYPSYGIGWYTGFIGDPQIFGNPNALFGFINFKLNKPDKRNVFEISPALGITYNLNPFDPETNPLNDAIGARLAVYFSLNYGASYQINRNMYLTYGVDLVHFSNGRLYQPNYGLNMLGLNLGLRYEYIRKQKSLAAQTDEFQSERNQDHKTSKALDEIRKKNSIHVFAALGSAQNLEDRGTDKRFATFSGLLDYKHRFSLMHAVTAGLDLFYDGTLDEAALEGRSKYLMGIHGGYDFCFWKMAIRLQVGTYLGPDKGKGAFFLRPALLYEFTNWLSLQLGLKTRAGAAADWIEAGLSLKPFSW